ncbi:MAG TPA: universal stress protein [Chloroflexota bacterium]|nr:universal stress protein [Chloroflexota bacterium]
MLKTILVPLDGTPVGEAALPYATSLARRIGATLTLVRGRAPAGSCTTARAQSSWCARVSCGRAKSAWPARERPSRRAARAVC